MHKRDMIVFLMRLHFAFKIDIQIRLIQSVAIYEAPKSGPLANQFDITYNIRDTEFLHVPNPN